MLSVDGTLIVILLSFIIFMVLMQRIYFTPMLAIKDERETSINSGKQAIESASQKRSQLEQEYDNAMADTRRKAQQTIQAKRDTAKAAAAEKLAAAREQALQDLSAKASALSSSKESVYQALQDDRETLSRVIVEKLTAQQRSATPVS